MTGQETQMQVTVCLFQLNDDLEPVQDVGIPSTLLTQSVQDWTWSLCQTVMWALPVAAVVNLLQLCWVHGD